MSKYRFISKSSKGSRWAITDIHGCSKTFKTLIEEIELTVDDQLFLLGDYIHRGPDSVGVIDFILELQAKQYQVFPIKGNHEDMILKSHAAIQTSGEMPLPSRFERRKGLVDEGGLILEKYLSFFDNLAYYYETDDFYLVHSGFNFKPDNDPLEDYKAMMWLMRPNREFEVKEFTDKKIIHGHFPTSLSDIEEKIETDSVVIALDNGCYKGLETNPNTELGNLCAFNLDTNQLVVQRNIE